MRKKILVLGAGIAGLSASYHLNKFNIKNAVFEKKNKAGGLLANFKIKKFIFDHFVHYSFAKDSYTKKFFAKSSPYFVHKEPRPNNYYKGLWLEHSPQLHLFPLNLLEKLRVIFSYIFRNKIDNKKNNNYQQWLEAAYGKYFAKNFNKNYTQKYWSLSPSKMETKWLEFRMPKINLKDLFLGAFTSRYKNTFYGSNLRYPQRGGYESFLRILKKNKSIKLNHEVNKIDLKNKKVFLKNKRIYFYRYIISTLPLTEICSKIINIPDEIKKSSAKLNYTSGILISICLNKKIKFRPWFYVYDKRIPFARAYSPSEKSKFNAPKNSSSLQLEIYYNKKYKNKFYNETKLKKKSIESLLKMNLFSKKDIKYVDIRKIEYANIVFDHQIYEARNKIINFLEKNNIFGAGRYGEWKYLWSNESFLSGKRAAEKIYNITANNLKFAG